MKIKRMISVLLSAALLAGLLVWPVSAAAPSGFTDITDEATAEAAEILRVLGVVEGTGGGLFQPELNLTRAEFCKMAMEIMGRGDEAAKQSGRVIFSDVKADHWAIGYINAAATQVSETEPPLVSGVGSGLFQPDDNITYGEAITILMRALGYSDQEVGMGQHWYDGYVNTAGAIGLTEGVSLSGGDAILRGQAALLFRNLLFANIKGTNDPYLTKLGAKELDRALILSVNAVAKDGTTGAIKTTDGTASSEYKTDRAPFPSSYEGTWGHLILDKNDKVLAIRLDETGSSQAVTVSESQLTYIKTLDGKKLDIENPESVAVYSAAGDQTAYDKLWMDLRAGTQLIFHYSSSGKLEYIYRPSGESSTAGAASMIAGSFPAGTNPFANLVVGVSSYSIYKNGSPATVGDIRKYDTAVYDAASGILHVSDLKLTGVYEDVRPNAVTPTSVKVMGHDFDVLSGAAETLSKFKLGDTATFLLTADGKIAGAISPEEARSTVIGVVQAESTSDNVVVKPVNLFAGQQDFTFSGGTALSANSVEQLKGQLVTVSSISSGRITVSRLTTRGSADGAWNVLAGTVGSRTLAANVKIFEKVGNSALGEVQVEDVTCGTVPVDKLLYVGTDYAGKVNLIILDDVTGDQYAYGFLSTGRISTGQGLDGEPIYNNSVTVLSKDTVSGNDTPAIGSIPSSIKNRTPGGIAYSLDTLSTGYKKLAGYVLLTAIPNVPRSAFTTENGRTTVTVRGSIYPVSSDVICYNEASGGWFTDLDEARAFSDSLTLYYDKAPEDGGKIRLIVAEK